MKNENVKKILVIRLSSLGDVILTTPLLRILKKQYPRAEVHYCVKSQFASVLYNNPNIDKIIEVENNIDFTGLKQLKKNIKAESYDIVIDAHNNLRSFYIRLFLPAKKFVFKKYSLRKFLLVKLKLNFMKNLSPIVNRYVNALGINELNKELPEIFTDEASEKSLDDILSDAGIPNKDLICIVPSSRHFTKTYPPEYYAELIEKFDTSKYTVVLTGTGSDRKNIDIIMSSAESNVYNLCDKLNITQLAGLMKRCKLVISGDTGPMHIAEAVEVNLIMLAGSSVREFGFYPQNGNSVVLENNNLKCRPCSHIGRSECPLGHFKCMRDISPEQVFSEAKYL